MVAVAAVALTLAVVLLVWREKERRQFAAKKAFLEYTARAYDPDESMDFVALRSRQRSSADNVPAPVPSPAAGPSPVSRTPAQTTDDPPLSPK
jgi:hypothetical protein